MKKVIALYDLGTLYPHLTGGMEIFNYYFLREQLNSDASIIYYITDHPVSNKGGMFIPSSRFKPKRLFYPLHFFEIIMRLRRKISFVYFSFAEQSWVIPFSQSLILQIFRVPYVVTIHWGKEPDWPFVFPYMFYFKNAHKIIGVSEPICKAYQKIFPDKDIVYIPPLIPFTLSESSKNLTRVKYKIDYYDKVFLYVGSIKKMKNPDSIVSAFKELGVQFLEENNIKLIFVGAGDMKETLVAQTSILGLSPFIRFEGLVNRERIPEYFCLADYYIISSDYEGTSVSLLEAMFNSLPILGSDAPGINGMLKDNFNALLFETRNSQQLSAQIKRLIIDKELSQKLAVNAKNDYETKYSFDKMLNAYRKIFSEVDNKKKDNI